MTDKYLLILDNEIQGYLDSPIEAKRILSDLADKLIDELGEKKISSRIYRENITDGIKIYYQELGTVFNGPVVLCHTLSLRKIAPLTEIATEFE